MYSQPELTAVAEQRPLLQDADVMVHAIAVTEPVPQVPPADFADNVRPITDRAGQVTDWVWTDQAHPAAGVAFNRWRNGFLTDRAVADLATVRNLMEWGHGHAELSEVGALLLDAALISSEKAARMAWQLRRAAEYADRTHAMGIGVFAEGHSGMLRGFACATLPRLLSVAGRDWIAATCDSLLLHLHDREPATVPVLGWSVFEHRLTIETDSGRVEVGDSGAARLPTRLAPTTAAAVVRPVPVTTVFSGLFVRLADVAAAAATSRSPLRVRHRALPHPW